MEKEERYDNQTLLDVFKQGDRVVQVCYEPDGLKREYIGVIKEIKKHCMAIQWEMVNGKPISGIREVYSIFHETEVFNGNEFASPITKDNN